MFPHAEEVNVEKWLENPVCWWGSWNTWRGTRKPPLAAESSAGAPRMKAGEEEEVEKGEADRVKPRPCDALHEDNLLTRWTSNAPRLFSFFLFWLYWIKSATLRWFISPSAQIKALRHQRSGTECWLYDYNYMQINWNSPATEHQPPPWTRPSLLLLNELRSDSGWCFAFIQKEMFLLSDSNKDKPRPGDPLPLCNLILLISGLNPHQYQGVAVALHSCTSKQKAV